MSVTWALSLKEPKDVYNSGDVISGNVKCAVRQPTKLSNIILSFKGKSRCQVHAIILKIVFVVREDVVQEQGVKGTFSGTVAPGQYLFPFSFTIPFGIPSSYEHGRLWFAVAHGKIKYTLTLTVQDTWIDALNTTFEREIFIQSYVKPEKVAETPEGGYGLLKTLFTQCNQRNQEINLLVSPSKHYVTAGDGIELKFHVKNNSDVTIKGIRTELVRKTLIRIPAPINYKTSKTFSDCTVDTPPITGNSEVELRSFLITLPKLTSVEEMNSLVVKFYLRVTICLPLPHTNSSVDIPIIIGDTRDTPVAMEQIVLSAMGSVDMSLDTRTIQYVN